MIVEDQLDRRPGRIGGVEKLEEFAAAMAVLGPRMDLPGDEVDAGQQADRAVALIVSLRYGPRVGRLRLCSAHPPLILPMSGRSWKSITGGVRILAVSRRPAHNAASEGSLSEHHGSGGRDCYHCRLDA
jgi:hypothetical protein